MNGAIEQFREFAAGCGYELPQHIEPGRFIRFGTNGKRGDDSGYAKLFPDLEGGIVGDFKTGREQVWQAGRERAFTDPEKAAWRAKLERERNTAEQHRQEQAAQAAKKAQALWKAATPAKSNNPYLTRKGVSPVPTLREIDVTAAVGILGYVPKSNDKPLAGRVLIAPVKIGDHISTCELIDEGGGKSAIAGGTKGGGYWAAQPLPEGNGEGLTVQYGEGVATTLSAKEANGHISIAALSAGNLEQVAQHFKERYPAARHVILADLVKATGEPDTRAVEAAQTIGGLLAIPDFGADRPEGAKDFNDLASRCGTDAVKRAIEGAKTSGSSKALAEVQTPASGVPDAESSGITLIRGCDLHPEPIRWLWNGWLAKGKLHILAGAPGTGKTTIALALAATVTLGGRWPDGTRCEPGNVLIWSGEDDPADTLLPRLLLQKADPHRVYFVGDARIGSVSRSFDPARDMQALLVEAEKVGNVHLLIVDPVVNAVSGDSHKNTEVRRSLQPLVDLATKLDVAALGISHFSKGSAGKDPTERVTGSLAFGALARVVMAAAKTETEGGEEQRLFARAKSNIGPDGGGFSYTIEQATLPDNPDIEASRVLWGKPLEGSARDLLAVADAPSDQEELSSLGNPPIKEYQPEVEFSRNLPRGGSLEEIAIYRQPDFGRSQAG